MTKSKCLLFLNFPFLRRRGFPTSSISLKIGRRGFLPRQSSHKIGRFTFHCPLVQYVYILPIFLDSSCKMCYHSVKVNYGDMLLKRFSIEEISKSKMPNIKSKWLIYTVLVGLIPVFSRMFIWFILQNRTMSIFNASDFVAFGLILHISNINAIEHFNDLEKSWKTIQNGISIAFISFYSVLFACSLLGQSNPGLINIRAITYFSIVFSFVSFLISFSVYHRISKLEQIP